MKNALQNLLLFMSMCLCALIAFQWHREAKLRTNIQSLNDTIHDKLENIQTLQGNAKRDAEEIKRLDGIKIELTETVKTNRVEITRLRTDLEKSDAENEKSLKLIADYKAALQKANESITQQNEQVKKQNEDMKKLSTDHAELVAKYNKVVSDFNDLAQKWNEAQAAAATNSASKK